MVTLHEVITFLVSMQISISSLQTHNVNRCGRSRHLARKLSLRRERSSPNVFEMAATETITSIILIKLIRVSLGTVRHPRRFKIVVIDIQITLKQMLRDFIGIRVNRAKKSGMVNITSSVNSRERSGINTILHELNPLFTINVTMMDIKSKNVYSRVNSKATTQWRKTEIDNGVHLEGVASDNRNSGNGNKTTNLTSKEAKMGKVMRHTLGASLNIRHKLSSSKGTTPLQLKLLTTYIPKTSAFTLALVPRNGCGRPGRAPERFLPLDITSLLLHVIFDARFLLRQFFFSSIRRHTRSDRDWSSDVCSSDLTGLTAVGQPVGPDSTFWFGTDDQGR